MKQISSAAQSRLLSFSGALLLWISLVLPLKAEITNLPNFQQRIWQVEDGLPQNKVTGLAQTADGYLWVGTYGGLARFDGVQFTIFDEKNTLELRDSRVTCLFVSSDSTLWIGHENGSVTSCKNGIFRAMAIQAAHPRNKIYGISEDETGEIWLLSEGGLLTRVRDGLTLSPPSGRAEKILNITRAPDGAILVARDGRLSRLTRDLTFEYEGDETNTYIQGVCSSRDGGLWVGSDGRLHKVNEGKRVLDLASPWGIIPLSHLIETGDGMLLAATASEGFFLTFPGTDKTPLHFNHQSGFPDDGIISLLEDREGTIWIGTADNGLVKLHYENVHSLTPPDHWRGRAVLSICPGKGSDEVWIGTEGAGLYHYQAGEWNNFGYTNGIGNSYIWSVVVDEAGQLWAGTWGGGLFWRDGENFKFAPGMENLRLPVPALLPSREGGLWVGTAAGLLRYQAGKTNWFTEAGGKPLHDVRTIAEGGGAVWFGMAGNGLARLETNRIQLYRRADGLPSDRVDCLHSDADGALWIGTAGGGLCRFKQGKFSVIDDKQGLPNNVISDIEDDGLGFFWMSSHLGLIRASKAELNDCAEGKVKKVRCLTYGVNDGLPTIECSGGFQPAGCRTSDGLLWFPTTKGLALVNPREIRINNLPPPMVLEKTMIDGQRLTNLTGRLRIPPGHSRFDFYYTALSLVAPEKVRFKYRIEGLEEDWVEAGTKRVANYNFLPPGTYTFRVIACNNDGIWNEHGVSLSFELLPYFWQTWWFRVLLGLLTAVAAGGAVWLNTRRRIRRKLDQMERQRELEYERSRIARDIHDDLGSQLTSITMLSDSARSQLDDLQQTAEDLNQIYETAREATRSMDEIVWAVNPNHDSMESLANYLEKFATDFLRAAGVKCRLDMPVKFPPWRLTSELRHNLFLAYKEALTNVAKHAGATEVRIRLSLEDSAFEMVIEDNGQGFDLGAAKEHPPNDPDRLAGGNGLENMHQRLLKIGGQCDITSVPKTGTKVKFLVTLRPSP